MANPNIYMMIGIPGSGKSQYAKSLANDHTVVISSDEIRKEMYGDISIQGDGRKVFETFYKRINEALQKGFDVVMDATNTTKRHATIELLRSMECNEIIGVYIDTPIKVCLERNKERNDRKEPVPEKVIVSMYQRLQAHPPIQSEGFNDIIVIHNDDGKDI